MNFSNWAYATALTPAISLYKNESIEYIILFLTLVSHSKS